MATGPYDEEAAKAAMLIVIATKKVTTDKNFFIRLKLLVKNTMRLNDNMC